MVKPQYKAVNADITASPGDRTFDCVMTSSAIDRDGEVLLPEGMHCVDFDKNPVLLWNHDIASPIGRVLKKQRQADRWTARCEIIPRPAEYDASREWFPDTLLHMMHHGVIRGVSVGFIPKERRRPAKKDKDMFGPEVNSIISKWTLLELSVTPLPANQDALITAVRKGIITAPQAAKMFPGIDVARKTVVAVGAVSTMFVVRRKKGGYTVVRR
jgi:HK97 family phage prohead protease